MKRIPIVLVMLCGCLGPARVKKAQLGKLPKGETSASPQWIPWRIGAGSPVAAHGQETALTELRQLTFDGRSIRPQWHPNGRQLLVERLDANGRCQTTVVIDLGHGGETPWPDTSAARVHLAKASSGHLLMAQSTAKSKAACSPIPGQQGWQQSLLPLILTKQPTHTVKAAQPTLQKNGHLHHEPAGSDAFIHGPSGRLLFRSSARSPSVTSPGATSPQDSQIFSINQDGGARRQLSHGPGYRGQASLSPDGSMLVWTAKASPRPTTPPTSPTPPESGTKKASVKTSSRSGHSPPKKPDTASKQTTKAPSGTKAPSPLPHRFHIMMASSSGHNPRMLTPNTSNNVDPHFSSDSRHLLVASDRNRRNETDYDIYLLDTRAATSSAMAQLKRISYSEGFNGQAVLSPDGQWIAFTSQRGRKGFDIFVARFTPDAAP